MIEYYLLQFLTPTGVIFVAVGFAILTIFGVRSTSFLFGFGKTKEEAVEDMKKRSGDETIPTRRLN